MKATRAYPFSLQIRGKIEAESLLGCWLLRHSWGLAGDLFDPRNLMPSLQGLPNNIMHSTSLREVGSGSRLLGQVTMNVLRNRNLAWVGAWVSPEHW